MGLIRSLLRALFVRGGAERLGRTVGQVARVFRPDATRRMELGHNAFAAVHASHAAEFTHARTGRFDALVNGLNRLPRPLLALGTLGLFVYAMADPAGFAVRMRGLAEVPEPLWWLLGAVVAFYFGAREAHHLREHRPLDLPRRRARTADPEAEPGEDPALGPADPPAPPRNPALEGWRSARPASPTPAFPAPSHDDR